MDKRAARQGFPLALALLALCLLWACVPPAKQGSAQTAAPAASLGPNDRITAWIADWDLASGLAEWRAHPQLFDSVRIFAAYFDQSDHAALSPAWTAALGNDVTSVFGPTPAYLTVVNDIATPTGKGNKLKDPELVRRLLATPQSRAAHIDELIRLAKRHHFAGIEIDYENVAAPTWPDFSLFIAELYAAASPQRLAVSIVLQPQRRYLTAPLPIGPAYVLMGYNLFGSHSGPGPKATPAFLTEQANSLRAIGLLGDTALALATGGFDWTEGKAAKQLTEVEAAALVAQKSAQSTRSALDGYLVSRYRDAAGKDHEVWHADAATFETLWQAARTAGFTRLAVWRLGGNAPALFDWLATHKH
ncbi:glycosyl hydrolase family 18 protein [Desulfovibrio sp. TomC]|uniref:glycosyl hydrolase family 18 protein n=1 Tax=Desulfovibrio sp. TomC TaxID=1562888 RepID=UPI0005750F85|nr:glycosyl hydrolase family 18 protein [Desulfovibrio sp. TomC]KHK03699.1 spore peptidoglycan hydrolase (N-acetylglucosaminidase) [Desulfovibrio sp. TomC]